MPSMTNEYAKAERELANEQQLQEKIVNEEFKIWKKTVPLLYDFVHTFALDSPSLVFQWLPQYDVSLSDLELRFLIGTNTIVKSENYLKLGSVTLPSTLVENNTSLGIPIPNEDIDTSNFKIVNQWKQPSEINKLKASPSGEFAVGFGADAIIRGFNLKNYDIIDYKYHKQEGNALDWIDDNSFISGSKDSQIALWHVDKPSTPIQLFKGHRGAVNDLSAIKGKTLFGSVSDDSTTQFYDTRSSAVDATPVISVENSHIQNCIQFHPDIETLYATAGKDNVISLYDIRNYKTPFRKFYGHNDTVRQLQWDWSNPNLLVSCGLDKRVLFWNLESLDEEFVYPDSTSNGKDSNSEKKQATKVDPCLKYIHGGHTSRINDFAIHPKVKNVFGSVGNDRLLEIWKPKTLPSEEEEEEEQEEEEAATEEQADEEMKEPEKEAEKGDKDAEMKD
ncbi:WD-40 repeat-containing protein MSI1 [Candida viswanathii]|uniref:WD-40 repeat-containing protein MSI1 n=1 Tax=Candida viswanathii TaxID=5486 RepID=A0A367YL03_9ASCO|nr:WD-40 repeat-containing protein MSI1 [Candida viswanathii]